MAEEVGLEFGRNVRLGDVCDEKLIPVIMMEVLCTGDSTVAMDSWNMGCNRTCQGGGENEGGQFGEHIGDER